MIDRVSFLALWGPRTFFLFFVFLVLLHTLREHPYGPRISSSACAFSVSPRSSPAVLTHPISKPTSLPRGLPLFSPPLPTFASRSLSFSAASSRPLSLAFSYASPRWRFSADLPRFSPRCIESLPARRKPSLFPEGARTSEGEFNPKRETKRRPYACPRSPGSPRPPLALFSSLSPFLPCACGRFSSACPLKSSAELESRPVHAPRQDSRLRRRRVFPINSKTFSGSCSPSSFLAPNLCSSSLCSPCESSLSSSSCAFHSSPQRFLNLSPAPPPSSLSPCSSSQSTRLLAKGEVATAVGREAPYPSFLVPSPYPPPPSGAETWEETGGRGDDINEEERIRRKAQAWRVDRSVLDLSPEELDRKVAEEKEELQQRWRTRLDVEQRRHQDYFEQQREDQRKLLNSLSAPPWVHLFRPVQLDDSPPLKYDFRVYQPYFRSLIEASKPFIHTKVIPPSAIQRFLERRHSPDFSLSSGFRFKQIQPLFAHNSGCSAFFYFHTCFSSVAPVFLNALRRTSLSRLESLAISAVKIEGAKHEFYSLPGIREDIVDDIFNNLGKIVFREKKIVYVHRRDIHAWIKSQQEDKERGGCGGAGEKGEERQEMKVARASLSGIEAEGSEAAEPGEDERQGRRKEHEEEVPSTFENEPKTRVTETSDVWNLLPPGTRLVRSRPHEKTEKGWASYLLPPSSPSSSDDDSEEEDMYYRIPVPLPPANFTHPLRAKLRVRGPLVAVAGHIQLPEGVEVVNKNQYLFTVNAGYYVNMDFKIERIREYVMPEFGYDSLERDRDKEGFMYFTNYVAPVPIFAYAAERRGEAVHTKWDEVNEDAPPIEVENEEEENDIRMTQVEDMLRQATAGAPDVVKASLLPVLQTSEVLSAEQKEEGEGREAESAGKDDREGTERGMQDEEGEERWNAGNAEGGQGEGEDAKVNEEGSPDRPASHSSLPFASKKPEDRYNAYRLLEPSEEMREAYRRDYLENDLPYQNLGEVVTLEVQTDGSLTPREAVLHCCDDLIKQVLDIQHALYHNCHIGVDGTEEEEFNDPDWYQDAHRYVGVPWNPYKGSSARSQKRQAFFFKSDVLRQYNILREKIDARREASAAGSAASDGGMEKDAKPSVWPVPGRGLGNEIFVASSPQEEEMMRGDTLREKKEAAARTLDLERTRLQQHIPEGLGPRSGPTYGLSERDLDERLLDEEEEEERIVNTSAIIRKEREEAWKDKQRTYRDLAENEPLKQLGDGKGLVRYPPDTKPMMEAPEWVMEDPMGQRKPIGFSEFNDD
ncbi:DNA-directed RNA polymerase alpha chain rpoA [Toxoplasma gondii GT1]|uniref:DNA-directed RNA polymerase alpha chain rpoA n=2 Tax=Toxoplasma gondii TaxID=5811 RepID=S7V0B8_TOXGG|nr:DNA-directed RNA polymerase alpha chain rpoA [Toxoplasma gondii GT1]RQX70612.1 DNA-directed RNA polymerase alpha chain rpoA [Toxoplasma gondii CAST]